MPGCHGRADADGYQRRVCSRCRLQRPFYDLRVRLALLNQGRYETNTLFIMKALARTKPVTMLKILI